MKILSEYNINWRKQEYSGGYILNLGNKFSIVIGKHSINPKLWTVTVNNNKIKTAFDCPDKAKRFGLHMGLKMVNTWKENFDKFQRLNQMASTYEERFKK